MMPNMRTTVTIDPDTELLIKQEIQRSGRSFKEVLNQSIRRSLAQKQSESFRIEPLFTAPFPAEFEGVSMNHLADALDDEDTLRELSR
jgi:hypothetical protein